MVKNEIKRVTSAAKSPHTRQPNSACSLHTYSHTRPINRCSDGNEATWTEAVLIFFRVSPTHFRKQTAFIATVTSAQQFSFKFTESRLMVWYWAHLFFTMQPPPIADEELQLRGLRYCSRLYSSSSSSLVLFSELNFGRPQWFRPRISILYRHHAVFQPKDLGVVINWINPGFPWEIPFIRHIQITILNLVCNFVRVHPQNMSSPFKSWSLT